MNQASLGSDYVYTQWAGSYIKFEGNYGPILTSSDYTQAFMAAETFEFIGTVNQAAFFVCRRHSEMSFWYDVLVGNATGPEYFVYTDGLIDTGGLTVPGSSVPAGAVATGGQII